MVVSLEKRNLVQRLLKEGMSKVKIAELLEISRSTVQRFSRMINGRRALVPKRQTGRPRSLTPREERKVVRRVLSEPGIDAVTLSKEISGELERNVTAREIRLTLQRNGFHGRKPIRKPRLNKIQRKRRLTFAREMAGKTQSFWRKVIFSDEAPFQIFPTFSGQWTWRRPHEKYQARNLTPTVKHGGGSLQIWGCMTYHGIGWMCKLPQGLDSETYLEILEDELQSTIHAYFPRGKSFVFQQDGASVHKSRVVQRYFGEKKIQVLDWPAQSPDLNPIEHLWADLKKRIARKRGDITSKQDLWEAIEEEWEATPKSLLRSLIDSMPQRIEAVIKAKGGPTKY